MHDYILSMDPSGAFAEGKGTTGWCLMHAPTSKFLEKGSISALGCHTDTEYWHKHILLLERVRAEHEFILLVEDYILYAHKADQQINSRFETSQLIGVIKHYAYLNKIQMCMQCASEVKSRWSNAILTKKRILIPHKRELYLKNMQEPVGKHEIDSIRHAIHYNTFYNK